MNHAGELTNAVMVMRRHRLAPLLIAAFLPCPSLLAQPPTTGRQPKYISTTVKSLPQGSYWRSCTDFSIAGDKLSATCQTIKGTWVKAEFPDPDGCPEWITNLDGRLACEAHQPGASFDRWTFKDGAPDTITALAQTADGFLWVGAPTGLFRFDGV